MTPAEARKQACRILRDAAWSMRRDLREVERLLAIAEGDDAEQVAERRNIEHELSVNPEFFVAVQS